MKTPLCFSLLASLAILSSGCVTGHRSFGVDVPTSEAPVPPLKATFAITDIIDSRHFENHPDDPSTPSVKGDVNALTSEQRSTFIGRQRNTYGHAMGDLALPEGQTVKTKVAELLTEGLRRRGYTVTGTGAQDTASVDIQEFWAWTTPGFFALSFEAHLSCRIVITREGKQTTIEVKGYALNHGQVAKDKNWQEAYEEAFEDFLKNLDVQLASAGF